MLSKEEIFELVSCGQLSIEDAMRRIEAAEEGSQTFPLSEAQKTLWITYQMDTESYAYNVPCVFKVKGVIDENRVRQTCEMIAKRHPILKSHVVLIDNQPALEINTQNEIEFQMVTLDGSMVADVDKMILDEVRCPMNLEKGPLYKVKLYSLGENEKILMFNFHHIIFDGISLSLFIYEFNQIYEKEMIGLSSQLEEIRAQYEDFVYWQQNYMNSSQFEEDKNYWLQQFQGDLPELDIIPDKQKDKYSSQGDNVDIVVQGQLFEQLQEMVEQQDVNLFHIMMTAYSILLHYYGNQEEIVIGTPVAGRPESRFENIIGYFVNMIPLKVNLGGNPTVKEVMSNIKKTIFEGFRHCNYPYFLLNKEITKDKAISSMYQVSFQYQNWIMDMERKQLKCKDFELEAYNNIQQDGAMDFSIEIHQFKDKLRVYFKFNPDSFETETMKSMAESYYNILQSMADCAETPIHEISLLTEERQQQIAEKFTGETDTEHREQIIFDLIDRHAVSMAGKVAVKCRHKEVTYKQLKEYSDCLAKHLIHIGVGAQDAVLVYMNRSVENMIAFLAVMKAGAIYVPIDPVFPVNRIQYIIEESGANLVLYNDKLVNQLDFYQGMSIDLTIESIMELEVGCHDLLKRKPKLEDIAYLLYTSGSTGNPKGVLIHYAGFINFVLSFCKKPKFTPEDYSLSVASFSFDFSVMEMYCPLVAGGTFEIVPSEIKNDAFLLKELIDRCKCNLIMLTPTALQMLYTAGWKSRYVQKVIFSGEALPAHLMEEIGETMEVWNAYGPTEVSVESTLCKVNYGDKITIGKPIDNMTIYIVNRSGQLMPEGVVGEICIGGVGVGRGYLNKPELNKEKYITNNYLTDSPYKIYKTGDLGRYLHDGSIEYFGRADHQVKLKGFRIELEEIEANLVDIQGVLQAVVVLRHYQTGNGYLHAFITTDNLAFSETRESIMKKLKNSMPYYMIPEIFTILQDLPYSTSTKTNRAYLMKNDIESIRKEYSGIDVSSTKKESNRSESEEKVISYENSNTDAEMDDNDFLVQCIRSDLKEIIGGMIQTDDEIGYDDDIGSYGFDSIMFTSLIVAMREKFGVKINITAFSANNTIQKFSVFLQDKYYQEMRTLYEALVKDFQQKKRSYAAEKSIGNQSKSSKDIAIIGVSGIYPDADGNRAFYQQLLDGKGGFTAYPTNRHVNDNRNASYIGAYLKNIRRFDSRLFNISNDEANVMDPQQRIMLETVWAALDNAGYDPLNIPAKQVSVLIGASHFDYGKIVEKVHNMDDPYMLSGLEPHMLAGRIADFYRLAGSAKVIQTSDSGALSAVAEGVEQIRSGNSDLVIAGGIQILLDLNYVERLQSNHLVSEQSRYCYPFDKNVQGYLQGEGAGVVILKSLEDAVHDKDNIYAVIKGYAENSTGHPSHGAHYKKQQVNVMRNALSDAGLEQDEIQYIEASGFANVKGDMTEFQSIEEAYHLHDKDKNEKCYIGCVKGNIGHLDGASGIAALTKVICTLHEKVIPKTIGIKEVSPFLDIDNSVLAFVTENMSWDRVIIKGKEMPRRAGINSFSRNGNNVHLILEEFCGNQEVNQQSGLFKIPSHEFAGREYWVETDLYKKTEIREPIQIIQTSYFDRDSEMMNFWNNLQKTREIPYGRLCEVQKGYWKALSAQGEKLIHALVQVPSSGKKIEVVTAGQGTPILFIPGFGITMAQWLEQFIELRHRFQVICIHMPGVGLSEPVPNNNFRTVSKIFMEVLELMDIKWPLHVVGSSWGGFQAQYMAAMYPDKIMSLILAGTTHQIVVDGGNNIEIQLQKDFEQVGAMEKGNWLRKASCFFFTDFEGQSVSTLDVASNISIPTLILFGEHDMVMSKKDFYVLADAIPDSILYKMEGQGHIPNVTDPVRFNQVIVDFISSHDSRVKKKTGIGFKKLIKLGGHRYERSSF